MLDTLGAAPPEGAVVLFDGTDLSNWTSRDGGEPGWNVADGIVMGGPSMEVVPKTGDIFSKKLFTDFFLHLEFRCPDMMEATGQAKGNSGVYLQGRYEIQVLDSHGFAVPGKGDCGAIYDQHAPLVNACRPAMEWQTYDVMFRAPRCKGEGGGEGEGAKVVERARVTVLHNGVVVQNNVELPGPTGGATDDKVAEPGPLRLQDHGDLVAYRNVWAVELPLTASDEYGPK